MFTACVQLNNPVQSHCIPVTDTRRGGKENCLPTLDFDGWPKAEISCHCNGSH